MKKLKKIKKKHIPAKQCTRTLVNLMLFSINSIAFSKYFDKS